jgi:hypothetical protein
VTKKCTNQGQSWRCCRSNSRTAGLELLHTFPVVKCCLAQIKFVVAPQTTIFLLFQTVCVRLHLVVWEGGIQKESGSTGIHVLYVRTYTRTLVSVEKVEWVPGWFAGDANADRYSFYVSIESQRDLILSLAHLLSLW